LFVNKTLCAALALLLAVTVPCAATAQPREIGDLTQGALLGEIVSTAQLQNDFEQHDALIAQATQRLGLTRADYEEVREDVRGGLARYVVLPRHLDGMAGERNGVAFAVRDVRIPAHVHGWEVDLDRPDGLVRVFVPNACGNISYVKVAKRRELARYRLPVPSPASAAAVAVITPPPPTPVPEDTPVPAPATTQTPAPQRHHSLWPLLALIPLAFLFHGSASTSMPINRPVYAPPPAPPTPLPTICPPPARIHH
jgi:hypothetical protein